MPFSPVRQPPDSPAPDPQPPVLPPPDAASLHQAALSYLARYAATEASLRRVLTKRIERWARSQSDPDSAASVVAAGRETIETVLAAMVASGALSDAGFAEVRARSLLRSGRSRRAIQARLLAKGVPADLARTAAGDDPRNELAAALVVARRRRIGPFRTSEPQDPAAGRRKEMGALARAGFARDTVDKVLTMDAVEAEQRINAMRSDQTPAD